ncbi:MAG TPA: hypothetical protein VK669_04620 [Candidatus Limnocylindrales bacterium]|nr:hypothetical protein [Candidatus Limnocylindrales bacterium]
MEAVGADEAARADGRTVAKARFDDVAVIDERVERLAGGQRDQRARGAGTHESVQEIAAVHHEIRKAIPFAKRGAEVERRQRLAANRIHPHHARGEHRGLVNLRQNAEAVQRPGRVWSKLQACADLAKLGSLFGDRGGNPVTGYCERGRETAYPATDDQQPLVQEHLCRDSVPTQSPPARRKDAQCLRLGKTRGSAESNERPSRSIRHEGFVHGLTVNVGANGRKQGF